MPLSSVTTRSKPSITCAERRRGDCDVFLVSVGTPCPFPASLSLYGLSGPFRSPTSQASASVLASAGVDLVERVAVYAVRLAGVLSLKAYASQHVLSIGHRLQVVWVYTRPGATQVIQLKAVRNWTLDELVSNAMGAVLSTVPPHHAVPAMVNETLPQPAAIRAALVNSGPEVLRAVQWTQRRARWSMGPAFSGAVAATGFLF